MITATRKLMQWNGQDEGLIFISAKTVTLEQCTQLGSPEKQNQQNICVFYNICVFFSLLITDFIYIIRIQLTSLWRPRIPQSAFCKLENHRVIQSEPKGLRTMVANVLGQENMDIQAQKERLCIPFTCLFHSGHSGLDGPCSCWQGQIPLPSLPIKMLSSSRNSFNQKLCFISSLAQFTQTDT